MFYSNLFRVGFFIIAHEKSHPTLFASPTLIATALQQPRHNALPPFYHHAAAQPEW